MPVAEPSALIPIVKGHQALRANPNYSNSFGSWTPASFMDEGLEQSWVHSWQPTESVPEGCHCSGELARLHCARGLCGNAVVSVDLDELADIRTGSTGFAMGFACQVDGPQTWPGYDC